MGLFTSSMKCHWCGEKFIWNPMNSTMTARFCSKKCIFEAGRSNKEIQVEKAEAKLAKAEQRAAEGSFIENAFKNIEATKKGINKIKSFFGKDKSLENENALVTKSSSVTEEIKKFKELFDSGIITEDEFNKKKKDLLGL